MPKYSTTQWFSNLGVGDGIDMATRGYLRALMSIGYEHLIINPRGASGVDLSDPDMQQFRSIFGFPEKFQPPKPKRVEAGDPRIGKRWSHIEESMVVAPPSHAPDAQPVTWDGIVQEGEVDQDYYREHPEELQSEWTPRTELLVCHYDPGQLARARDALALEMSGGYTPIVGITAWEPNRIRSAIAQQISDIEVLVVPSEHTAKAFRRSGLDPECPIRVVPHALMMAPLSEEEFKEASNSTRNRYVFYTIGTNIERKNLRGVIAAYCRAFAPKFEHVGLVIKTSGDPKSLKKLYQEGVELGARRGWPKIALFGERWPDEKIRALHLSSNCWVDATRGEGFGLGPLDAAAVGNPIITTGWGAQMEILEHTGVMGSRIDYELVNVPAEMSKIGPYQEDQQWAEPNIDDLADRMRQAAQDRWFKSGAQARTIAEAYSLELVGKKLASAFELAKNMGG